MSILHLWRTWSLWGQGGEWMERLCPPKSVCWNPNPNMMILGTRSWVCSPHEWDLCPYKETKRPEVSLSLSLPCEDTIKTQVKGPHQTLDLRVPWSWTSWPLELWEIRTCCLCHPMWDFVNKVDPGKKTKVQSKWLTAVRVADRQTEAQAQCLWSESLLPLQATKHSKGLLWPLQAVK